MKHLLSRTFLLVACAALLLSQTAFARRVKSSEKKLIHFGWVAPSQPDQFLKSDLKDLDETCPFDGIGLYPDLKLKRGDKVISYYLPRQVGAPQMLTKEDFKDFIPAFRRLQETRLKHNFFRANSSLFNADWFDDEGWKRTLNNFGMLAWAAKESMCDGLCIDIEAYPYTNQPFRFRPELGRSFKETAAQVRKRGKEWIEELNRQFPDITLFTFFWTSQCNSSFKADHPEYQNMTPTGLQIAFFNGVYDGAPDTMKIVDGNEGAGYQAATEADYTRIVANFYLYGSAWIDEKNQDKFRKITTMGVALYLDSYVPRENAGGWNLFTRTDNPTNMLAQNIANCLNYSDEYVWVWCEKGNFWPKICKSQFKFWNENLPYCVEALRAGKDMQAAMFKYANKEKNLLANSTLEAGASGAPNGPDQTNSGIIRWSSWQSSHSPKGTIKPENGMARFINVTEGNIAQATKDIKVGEQLVITARAKNEGMYGSPKLDYFFRNSQGQGLWALQVSTAFNEDLGDGWKRATAFITVPPDNDIVSMTVCVGVSGSQDPKGEDKGILFDDIEMYRVEYPWMKK